MTLRLLALLACGLCACVYTGSARDLTPETLKQERGWIAVEGVRPLRQRAEHDCGPTALLMVLNYWHKPPADLRRLTASDVRITAAALRDEAKASGLLAYVMEGNFEDILYELKHERPVIVGMAKPTVQGAVAHYEVVIGVHPQTRRVATIDPASGWRQNSVEGFLHEWVPTGSVLLVFMPKTTTDVKQAPTAQEPSPRATAPANRASAPTESPPAPAPAPPNAN